VAGGAGSTVVAGSTGAGEGACGRRGGAFAARLVVIVPALEEASYRGGSIVDEASALAIAPTTGEVYVAGVTDSTDFPGTSGGAQSAFGGIGDAFVARLNASLTAFDQATYLGGSGFVEAGGASIGPTAGEVDVAGATASTDC